MTRFSPIRKALNALKDEMSESLPSVPHQHRSIAVDAIDRIGGAALKLESLMLLTGEDEDSADFKTETGD